MNLRIFLILYTLLSFTSPIFASPASDAAFSQFKTEGASNFSAEHGKLLWSDEVINKDGEKRSCTTCHGPDPRKSGMHATTKKVIEPMAVSANAERLTDLKKMDKWFKRNCDWAWGRECTAQEKGDILKFLTGSN